MSDIPPTFNIRPSQPADEPAVIEICHLTGNTRIDSYLLALRWCLDYIWHEPKNCFVAEERSTGKVIGYIVGTLDTHQQEQRLAQIMLPKIQAQWRKIKPKTFSQWRDYVIIRASFRNPASSMITEYPAHLHINVHPDYQRLGIGKRLLSAYEKNLTLNSVTGYHLGVESMNQTGISFYKKEGLTRLGQFPGIGKRFVIFYGKKLE